MGSSFSDTTLLGWGRQTVAIEREALADLESAIDNRFARAVRLLAGVPGKVIVCGMGKSGLISRKIAATLTSTGTPAFFLHPAESIHGDLGMVSRGDGLIAISHSGETSELTVILPLVKRIGIPVVALTGRSDSTLGRLSDICLEVPIRKEACPHNLAPTASTTATLALGDALAMALLNLRGFQPEDFHDLHPGGALGRRLRRVGEVMLGIDRLPLVNAGDPLERALEVMSGKIEGHGRGTVGVVDGGGQLVGVITDGDLRRLLMRGGSAAVTAAEAMTPNPKSIGSDALVESALELMEKHSINALFVHTGDRSRPAGILYLHTLLRAGVV